MAMGVPDPRTGIPRGLPTEYDPLAAVRRLKFTDDPGWVTGRPEDIGNTRYLDPSVVGAFNSSGLQSKYSNFSLNPDGTISGTLQRPGGGKYDTMLGTWAKDPVAGDWALSNDPFQNWTQQTSSKDSWRDVAEKFGLMAAFAAGGMGLQNALAGAAVDATGGAALDGLMSGLGGEAAADLTTKELLYGAAGYGQGMTGLQTSIYDGVLGLTGSGGLASVASGSNVMEGLRGLASSALGSAAGGTAMSGGWLGNLASLYGLYLNKKGLDNAEDAMGRAGELSSSIANRQMGLAEEQYRDYKTGVLPKLMGSMDKADQRADLASQQAAKMFDLNYADADRYSKRWRDVQVPLEDSIIAEAQRLGTPQEEERVRGLALADVRGQGEMMRAAGQRDAARRGVNPASAAAMALASDAFLAEGLAGAGAMTNASFGVKDRYRAAMTDAAALGRNLPGFASSASGAGTAAGGLQLNSGTGNVGAQAQGANAMSNFNQGINQGWNNASSTAFNGYRAASDYASLVANSPFSTMAGIGMYPWLQPPRS